MSKLTSEQHQILIEKLKEKAPEKAKQAQEMDLGSDGLEEFLYATLDVTGYLASGALDVVCATGEVAGAVACVAGEIIGGVLGGL